MNDAYQINIDSNIKQHGEIITNSAIATFNSLENNLIAGNILNTTETTANLQQLKEDMLDKADKSEHAHLTLTHYYKLEEIPFYQQLHRDPEKTIKMDSLFGQVMTYRISNEAIHQIQESGLVVKDVMYFDLDDEFRFEFIVSYHKKTD